MKDKKISALSSLSYVYIVFFYMVDQRPSIHWATGCLFFFDITRHQCATSGSWKTNTYGFTTQFLVKYMRYFKLRKDLLYIKAKVMSQCSAGTILI
jgi:hypothetical protein